MNFTYGQFVEICSSEPIMYLFVDPMVEATCQVYYISWVLQQAEGDKLLVCKLESFDDGDVKFKPYLVSRHQLRPSPPQLNRMLVVSDMVDVFVDNAWRVGVIIFIDDFGCHVKLTRGGTVRNLRHYAFIRHHLEWDGIWRFHNQDGVLTPVPQNMIIQNEFQSHRCLQRNHARPSVQRGPPGQGGLPRLGTSAQWNHPRGSTSAQGAGGLLRAGTSAPLHFPQAITSAQWDQPRASTSSQGGMLRLGTSTQWHHPQASTSALWAQPQASQWEQVRTSAQWTQPQTSTLAQWDQPQASTSAELVQPHVSSLAQWGQPQALDQSVNDRYEANTEYQGGQPLEQLDQLHGSSLQQLSQGQASTLPQWGHPAHGGYQASTEYQVGQPLEQLGQPQVNGGIVAQLGQLQPSTSAQYGNQANTENQRDHPENDLISLDIGLKL